MKEEYKGIFRDLVKAYYNGDFDWTINNIIPTLG